MMIAMTALIARSQNPFSDHFDGVACVNVFVHGVGIGGEEEGPG